jgi:eukaryotic-like serine/threonine-protein kinase
MTPDRDEILDLIAQWEEAKAQGLAPVPEDLCRNRPELLDEFRRQVVKLEQVEWLNRPIEGPETATACGCPREARDVELPRMVAGRYRLDALIGEGGFGRVYRAFDTWLERPVAVKVPRVDRPVTLPEVDLCRLEARKVARLRHPNIVAVHDVGQDGGSCFIVSEWIEGVDLATRIKAGRPGYRESARIAAEIAEALGQAHRMGYVHRDIKPANILLDSQGQAFLTDFGIAVVEEELLRDGSGAGTPPYMAPEQLGVDLGPMDHRSDIYSMGVVLYELLTGRRPFEAGSPAALRDRILAGSPPPPRAIERDVPGPLERICLRCLATKPADRYQAAEDVAADLRALLNS